MGVISPLVRCRSSSRGTRTEPYDSKLTMVGRFVSWHATVLEYVGAGTV